MSKFMKLGILVGAIALNGCASIIDGKNQTMTLNTRGNVDKSATECELRNTKGTWVTDGKESLMVRRDSADMIISCENESQEGEMVLESSASVGWMAANFFMWDLCTISCIVDHSTGSLYEYPMSISVPMRNKQRAPMASAAK
jgi:hypothetical protein